MARIPTRRARPTIPPATPPAIAAVFGFGADVSVDFDVVVSVWSAEWSATVAAGVLVSTWLDVSKPSELLVKEEVVLGTEALTAESMPKGRSVGQPPAHALLSFLQQPANVHVLSHVVLFLLARLLPLSDSE